MSRNEAADYTDLWTDKNKFCVLIRVYPWLGSVLSVVMFNSVVYWNQSFSAPNTVDSNGDQVALFYCEGSLDQSESSMLVSAGFESHRPVNS